MENQTNPPLSADSIEDLQLQIQALRIVNQGLEKRLGETVEIANQWLAILSILCLREPDRKITLTLLEGMKSGELNGYQFTSTPNHDTGEMVLQILSPEDFQKWAKDTANFPHIGIPPV